MSIEVRSPYSGEMVKIMPKDVGKAVKDRDGRVFYVLEDDEGGYYPSMTRSGEGSAKAQGDHARTEERMAEHHAAVAERGAGSGKRPSKGYLAYMVVIGIVIVAVWAFVYGPLQGLVMGE